MKTNQHRSVCPISYTLDVLGDKWSLLILRDLLLLKKRSFSEFLASPERIASNILTSRLSDLVSAKLLIKEIAPTNKSKFLYRPTQQAIDLIPVLCEIILWGDHYNEHEENKIYTDPLRRDKQAAIENYKRQFNQHF